MNLPSDIKTRVDEHIRDVQKNLGDLPADEQREILQSLEIHIHDALESRAGGQPTIAVLEAIIAEMDPPESYGETPLIASPNRASLSSGRKIAFFSAIAILGLLFIAIWLADPFSSQWMSRSAPDQAQQKNPVKADADIIGKWVAVDFVEKPENFEPGRKSWRGDLFLEEFEFKPDGATQLPSLSWKNGVVLHADHNHNAEFVVLKIQGKEYLFLQWINGDVVAGREAPHYYVFTRE